MPAINLKEIPEAHVASGEQDTFELFAADFLESLAMKSWSGQAVGLTSGRIC